MLMLMYISKALLENAILAAWPPEAALGETEPTEHGPSTLTGIDHDDENDLLKDLTEIRVLWESIHWRT